MLIYKNTFFDENSKISSPNEESLIYFDIDNNINLIIYDKFGNIKLQFEMQFKSLIDNPSALPKFVENTKTKLDQGDIILAYSDGFSNFLCKKSFIFQLLNFNKNDFENYILEKTKSDYNLYGKTKSIFIFKV